ncbi:MAG: threonine--tRNA ligase [Planctomycetota bacterium]|jgi:threonyl-tRNA synthetase
MQRIRGTAFFDEKSLKLHLKRLEEAKKRDHRRIGREMDLFSLQPEGPGFPFWHPKGVIIYNALQDFIREELERRGYGEVRTPVVLTDELWKRSGHWEHFRDDMYTLEIEDRSFAVKPMNCPGTCLVYASRPRSYRELPLRLAEFSPLHRNELSGTLHGLLRVRAMCQDDAHVYCDPADLQEEIIDMIDMVQVVYPAIGFRAEDIGVRLATRPDEGAMGSEAVWAEAEKALADALEAKGMPFTLAPGEGAFYGPKIEFHVTDAIGRTWQCGTIQVDFSMPERFELEFTGRDGQRHCPVMIHRAILGSFERLIGVLIEHHEGKFPLWLAPVQARVLPITDAQNAYGEQVRTRLREAGIRAELDEGSEKVGAKIRTATLERVPYMLVVGKRESESGQVAVREQSGKDHGAMDLSAFLDLAHQRVRDRT